MKRTLVLFMSLLSIHSYAVEANKTEATKADTKSKEQLTKDLDIFSKSFKKSIHRIIPQKNKYYIFGKLIKNNKKGEKDKYFSDATIKYVELGDVAHIDLVINDKIEYDKNNLVGDQVIKIKSRAEALIKSTSRSRVNPSITLKPKFSFDIPLSELSNLKQVPLSTEIKTIGDGKIRSFCYPIFSKGDSTYCVQVYELDASSASILDDMLVIQRTNCNWIELKAEKLLLGAETLELIKRLPDSK